MAWFHSRNHSKRSRHEHSRWEAVQSSAYFWQPARCQWGWAAGSSQLKLAKSCAQRSEAAAGHDSLVSATEGCLLMQSSPNRGMRAAQADSLFSIPRPFRMWRGREWPSVLGPLSFAKNYGTERGRAGGSTKDSAVRRAELGHLERDLTLLCEATKSRMCNSARVMTWRPCRT